MVFIQLVRFMTFETRLFKMPCFETPRYQMGVFETMITFAFVLNEFLPIDTLLNATISRKVCINLKSAERIMSEVEMFGQRH